MNRTKIQKSTELSRNAALKQDTEKIFRQRHNPFVKRGKVDVDAYIAFVTQYNEFINHNPKPFNKIVDKNMKL